jgi:hypothetical protein
MKSLKERLLHVPQVGQLAWIGVRPAHDAPMVSLREAELVAERGVAGDRAAAGRTGGKRQVTLLQREHLTVIAALGCRGAYPGCAPERVHVHAAIRAVDHPRVVVVVDAEGHRTIIVTAAPLQSTATDPLPWSILSDCDALIGAPGSPMAGTIL